MGIANLWDEIGEALRPRVTLEAFVADFLARHGRFPRVALDAYIFLQGDGAERNLMIKVMNLVALNVAVVVVLDGRLRPAKLRNDASGSLDWQAEIAHFTRVDPKEWDEDSATIRRFKAQCRVQGIDYFQAPGEAEAQCAVFQKWGVVDYVVTNDSDVLVFGATRVLRNFNKYPADIMGNSPHKLDKVGTSKHYWVTPVHMEDITERYHLTPDRLVFLASLRGGDYSLGAERIGIKNAMRLAICGTPGHERVVPQTAARVKSMASAPSQLSDIATMARDCFVTGPFGSLPKVNHKQVAVVESTLQTMVQAANRAVFGRLVTAAAGIVVDVDLYLLYLFPVVAKALYFFCNSTFSGTPDPDFLVCSGHHHIPRINMGRPVGVTHVVDGSAKFEGAPPPVTEPRWHEYRSSLTLLVVKLLVHRHPVCTTFTVQAEDVFEGVHHLCVVYEPDSLLQVAPLASDARLKQRMPNRVYVPTDILTKINPELEKAYRRSIASPFKTLDAFGICNHRQSPTRKSPPKRRRASPKKIPGLERGQSHLDLFFSGEPSPKRVKGRVTNGLPAYTLGTPPVLTPETAVGDPESPLLRSTRPMTPDDEVPLLESRIIVVSDDE
ncbi:hypothetical protein DICA0_C13102 [Diutina catenulata]